MRYDTLVTFYQEQKSYDTKTSKHVRKVKSWSEWANVTDLSTAKQVELLGSIAENTKTVRLTQKPRNKWLYLTIGDKTNKYKFVSSVLVSKGYAMIVGEDNGKA